MQQQHARILDSRQCKMMKAATKQPAARLGGGGKKLLKACDQLTAGSSQDHNSLDKPVTFDLT